MTIDPLPTHDTRVVPPLLGGIHLIEHTEGKIFMMGWERDAPLSISLYEGLDLIEYAPGQ